jgi:hypothetical protein
MPSYEGGPDGRPYGIVQPEADVKMWKIDGKTAFNKDGETYAAVGNHTFTFRIDHPMESDEQKPYMYVDLHIPVAEGHRYRVGIKGDFDRPPPYDYELEIKRETKIAGYDK